MAAFVDETGNRHGRLTVIARFPTPDGHGQAYWLCRCDCGNEVVLPGGPLRTGQTRSCGCLRAESARTNGRTVALPEGEAAFRALFKTYRYNAKTRGIAFLLSREQFRALTQQNCHYCGSEPLSVMRGVTYNRDYVYNGVDRIDSALGYVPENCVPCCKFCNLAKAGGSYEDFVAYLNRVAAFWRRR